MAGSTFGKIFQMTTWGESHGQGIGVVVDGCPAGLELNEEKIQKYLKGVGCAACCGSDTLRILRNQVRVVVGFGSQQQSADTHL